MKIGIITFHNTNNFGAALQAYALQYYLMNQNHDVEFINYRLKAIDEEYALLYKPSLYLSGFKKSFFHLFYRIGKCILESPYKFNRKIKFNTFTTQYLNIGKLYDESKKTFTYDLIICGSDQIWNPKRTYGFKKEYFGQIANSNKKIAYAASMGEYDLKDDDKAQFAQLINQLDLISVREYKAKEICNVFTDKHIEVVVDPVFLLNDKEWNELDIPDIDKKNYILLYNINKDKELQQKALELSNKYGYKIVELEVKDCFNSEKYIKIYSAGPKDFLGWIKNAEIVLTSSFHGAAFSIIYKKKFYASNTTRIESLLKQVGLEDRLLCKDINHTIQTNSDINYDNVHIKLEKLINHSKKFLNIAQQKNGKICE